MFRSTVDLTVETRLKGCGQWNHNVRYDNYTAYGCVGLDVFLGDVQINMDVTSLWKVLGNENALGIFREQSCECVSQLKEQLLSKCEGKVLERDTNSYDYLTDVSITYMDDSTFCIVVCTMDALEHLEEHWKNFLDKEFEEYERNEEESERC